MAKIQITILGKEPLPVYYAITEFDSDMIHLIGTKENRSIGKRIKSVVEKSVPCKIHIVEAYNPTDMVNVCETIHSKSPNDEYIYNLTGGTKIMSLAAFSIAVKYGAKTIYTTQTNEIVDMQTYQITPMKCILSNENIFILQGQDLKSFDILNRHNADKVNCAKEIKEFIETNNKVYSNLSYYYSFVYKKNLHENIETDNRITLSKTTDGLTVEKEGELLLQLSHPDAADLLFEGRWWETLVADALLTWSESLDHPYEIWQNVKFSPKAEIVSYKDRDKNEVDILINIGTKILFIECKSGKITQDNIYKIDAVRSTYGGNMSKAVLTSYYPIDEIIKEKAKELDIRLFAPEKLWQRSNFLDNINSQFKNIIERLNI